ncbi:MAG: sensor histidine kinase [Candidatus Pacearchaeota archaeon]|jgi:signal transduction histidine kinase
MKLFIFLFLTFVTNFVSASINSNHFQDKIITLSERDVEFIDANGLTEIQDILSQEKLGKNKWKIPRTLNLGYGPSPKWYRINIKNDNGAFTLKYLYPMMQTVKMYLIKDNNVIIESLGGKKFKNETYRGVLVNSELKGWQTVLVYLDSSGPFQVPFSVGSYKKMQYQISIEYLALGVWFGLILALMIYYFIIFLKLRDAMYLYYSLYGLSLLVINLSFSGIFYQYIPNFSPYLKPRLAIVSIGLMLVFLTLFSKFFFEIFKNKGLPRLLTLTLDYCFIIPLILTLINLINYSTITIIMTGVLGIVVPLILIGIAFYMIAKGKHGSYLYIMATGSVLTGFIIYCLKDFAILPHNHFTYYSLFYTSSLEMLLLAVAIANKFRDIQIINESLIKSITLKEKNEALTNIAQQLAHDIRSPLEVMRSIKEQLIFDNTDANRTFQMSINRIEEIAFNLLNTHKEMIKIETEEDSVHLLEILKSIVLEKRIEFRIKSSIDIVEQFDTNSFGLFSHLKRGSLKTIISNLINNSIESFNDRPGIVNIQLTSNNCHNIIYINDNGSGLSHNIKNRIFTKGFTTKMTGNGLGLFNAKNEIESWGGTLSFESKENEGTSFIISLPKSQAAPSFIDIINTNNYEKIIILDDDLAFHEVWNNRLKGLVIKVEHIHSIEEMFLRFPILNSKILLLSDFELMDKNYDGIDTILKLNHAEHSILVTARSEELAIQERCSKANIKILPKLLINYVKVVSDMVNDESDSCEEYNKMTNYKEPKYNVVLIDDDKLVHINWSHYCNKKGITFSGFKSIDDFILVSKTIDKSSNIYIDSNLGEGIKGEIESEKIFNIGFLNLFLSTGYDKNSIVKPQWLKEIYSKNPEEIFKNL